MVGTGFASRKWALWDRLSFSPFSSDGGRRDSDRHNLSKKILSDDMVKFWTHSLRQINVVFRTSQNRRFSFTAVFKSGPSRSGFDSQFCLRTLLDMVCVGVVSTFFSPMLRMCVHFRNWSSFSCLARIVQERETPTATFMYQYNSVVKTSIDPERSRVGASKLDYAFFGRPFSRGKRNA